MRMKMLLKLIVPAVALLALTLPGLDGAKEMSLRTLKKNYDKLNAQLAKSPSSVRDPEKMMITIELLIQKILAKSYYFFRPSESYTETLRMLARIRIGSHYGGPCDAVKQKKSLLEKLDSVWYEDSSRGVNLNYPLTKIDEFLAYWGLKAARHCQFNGHWPTMNYAYKQLAYDYINQYLLAQQPKSEDIEANLGQVQEHLDETDDKNGALAQALKQILELRKTVLMENCNETGYEILLKNDLATSGRARTDSGQPAQRQRRIDKIVKHFMVAHKELCRPNRETFSKALKRLSVSSYRCVLALVSYYYHLGQDIMKDLIQFLNHKEVDGDFTTPMMEEYIKRTGTKLLPEVDSIEITHLRSFVRVMNGDGSPKAWSTLLEEQADRKKFHGSMIRSKGAVNDLLDKYLILPCSIYLESVGGLSEADLYSRLSLGELDGENNEEESLSHHMILAAYRVCKFVATNKWQIYYGFGYV